ncbi:MAG: OST-HTH/LOTUS domain-containing protein [Microscillaceae bacterium]|nr:OST-HTH/LOTUS domain-containing protein [Microscillaceae bacterium]
MNVKTINPKTFSTHILSHAQIEQTLVEAVKRCADETGWANLAEIGTHLRNAGIQYGKLSKFLNDFSHVVEKKIDTSVTPPVVLAKLISKN